MPARRRRRAVAWMLALEASASAMSSSRPATEAFPDRSSLTSTRQARLALSLRFSAAFGSSFISRAAARRASVSARTSGAAAARISSALAASSGLRQPV